MNLQISLTPIDLKGLSETRQVNEIRHAALVIIDGIKQTYDQQVREFRQFGQSSTLNKAKRLILETIARMIPSLSNECFRQLQKIHH